jgi:type III secretory pathway component EscT
MLPALQSILTGLGVHTNIQDFLMLFFLIFTRIAAALNLTPFLGGKVLPGQIKVGLAVMIAALLFPGLNKTAGPMPDNFLFYCALLGKEFIVGMMIGFISQMVFFGVQIAGTIIDTQRGLNQITYLAPELPGNVSATGNLQIQASIALFLVLGGHLFFIRSLGLSFLAIPPIQLPHMTPGWEALAEEFTRISASAIRIGVQLCAPAVLTIFLVDVSFGSIQKVASSLKISNDTNTAKSWIGLAVFCLSVPFFFEQLLRYLASMIPMIDHFVKSLA